MVADKATPRSSFLRVARIGETLGRLVRVFLLLLRWPVLAEEDVRPGRGALRRIAALCAAVLSFLYAAPPVYADLDAGADWLTIQSNADGSFTAADDLATPFQGTSEALRALRALGIGDPVVAAGQGFVDAENFHNTGYLSRKIVTGIGASVDVQPWLTGLAQSPHTDGSFGDRPGYDPTNLDTAYAVEALASAGQIGSSEAGLAMGFLLNAQNPDGGWGLSRHVPNNDSSVFFTALVVNALAPYRGAFNIQTPLSAAQGYLLQERGTDVLWGEAFVSALALIALVTSLDDLPAIADSLSALRALQQPEGGAIHP